MLMFLVMFVVRASIAESHFARETCFRQQLQRAIDSGVADARILIVDEPVKIVARKMFFSSQKHLEDQVSLRGALQSLVLDVLEEDFLLFSHKCGRCESYSTTIEGAGRILTFESASVN